MFWQLRASCLLLLPHLKSSIIFFFVVFLRTNIAFCQRFRSDIGSLFLIRLCSSKNVCLDDIVSTPPPHPLMNQVLLVLYKIDPLIQPRYLLFPIKILPQNDRALAGLNNTMGTRNHHNHRRNSICIVLTTTSKRINHIIIHHSQR